MSKHKLVSEGPGGALIQEVLHRVIILFNEKEKKGHDRKNKTVVYDNVEEVAPFGNGVILQTKQGTVMYPMCKIHSMVILDMPEDESEEPLIIVPEGGSVDGASS